MPELTPHARHNRDYWTTQASEYAEPARRHWASDEPTWGIWEIPEATVGALPDVSGLDVVELGCGTGRKPAIDSQPSEAIAASREDQIAVGSLPRTQLPDRAVVIAVHTRNPCSIGMHG